MFEICGEREEMSEVTISEDLLITMVVAEIAEETGKDSKVKKY